MSLSEFETFVYGACHVDKEDPVAEWKKISKRQQILGEMFYESGSFTIFDDEKGAAEIQKSAGEAGAYRKADA